MKTILACALGPGFLLMEANAKSTVAFLGLSEDSDPLIRRDLENRIRFELAADSSLISLSEAEIAPLFARGALNAPEAGQRELPMLARQMGAQFYAFGRLEPLVISSQRHKWMPWKLAVTSEQGLRLRVVEAATARIVFDGVVPASVAEKRFVGPVPEGRLNRVAPLERERYLREFLPLLSAETAKALSQALGDGVKAVVAKGKPAQAGK